MTKESNGRQPMYMSTSTRFFVWERFRNFRISNGPTNTKNYLVSMENKLNSSEIFSQDTQHCCFSNRFKTQWQLVQQVEKKSKIESSSCLFSTTSIGPRMEISNECISNFEMVKDFAKRYVRWYIALFSAQENKKNGMERAQVQTWRKVQYDCRCHDRQCQKQKTSSNPTHQCVGSGIPEKERWTMYDSHQHGILECGALSSHNSSSKSASVSTE